jgi:hypothetical protein
VKAKHVPAGSDDSSFVQLRTTLEVVAAEHKLHLREVEVREISTTKQGSAIRAKKRQHMGCVGEAGATAMQVSLVIKYKMHSMSWYRGISLRYAKW